MHPLKLLNLFIYKPNISQKFLLKYYILYNKGDNHSAFLTPLMSVSESENELLCDLRFKSDIFSHHSAHKITKYTYRSETVSVIVTVGLNWDY